MNQIIQPKAINFNELVKNSKTTLTLDCQSDMIELLNKEFTEEQSQWYIANLYMYLNFDPIIDFPINLDNVFKMIGFANKGNAMKTIKSNFTRDEDYKVALFHTEKRKNEGGFNKEDIMLNVDTFKNLCMIVKTPQGKEIRKYYVKLENIHNKIIKKEIENKDRLLEEKEQLLIEKNDIIEQLENKPETEGFNRKPGYIYIADDTDKLGHKKIGSCGIDKINKRLDQLNVSSSTRSLKITHKFKTFDVKLVEEMVHSALYPLKIRNRNEWFYIKNDLELNYIINTINNCVKFAEKFNIKDISHLNNVINKEKKIKDNILIEKVQENVIENNENEENYTGVIWTKSKNKWKSSLGYNKKNYHLGYFTNKIEAAKTYNDYALYVNQTHNKNYKLNDIPEYITTPRNIPEKNKNLNQANKTSKYQGVHYVKSRDNYNASISVNGKSINLASGKSEIEAAKIYNQQALFYNNTKRTNYILNDIPDYITEPKDIKTENNNIRATKKSSKYIGVMWAKDISSWKALLVYNKTSLHLGLFSDEIEAAKVYNQQALFLNNEKKTKYKLNDIPNFITKPNNIYNEKYKDKLIK